MGLTSVCAMLCGYTPHPGRSPYRSITTTSSRLLVSAMSSRRASLPSGVLSGLSGREALGSYTLVGGSKETFSETNQIRVSPSRSPCAVLPCELDIQLADWCYASSQARTNHGLRSHIPIWPRLLLHPTTVVRVSFALHVYIERINRRHGRVYPSIK